MSRKLEKGHIQPRFEAMRGLLTMCIQTTRRVSIGKSSWPAIERKSRAEQQRHDMKLPLKKSRESSQYKRRGWVRTVTTKSRSTKMHGQFESKIASGPQETQERSYGLVRVGGTDTFLWTIERRETGGMLPFLLFVFFVNDCVTRPLLSRAA